MQPVAKILRLVILGSIFQPAVDSSKQLQNNGSTVDQLVAVLTTVKRDMKAKDADLFQRMLTPSTAGESSDVPPAR